MYFFLSALPNTKAWTSQRGSASLSALPEQDDQHLLCKAEAERDLFWSGTGP